MSIVQQFFKQVVTEHLSQQVSDVYLLPIATGQYQLLVRTPIKILPAIAIAPKLGPQVITYLKYLANLDITEQRRPQTGQFTLPDFPAINFRISTVGDYQHRETLVCRFIYDNHTMQPRFIFPTQLQQLLVATAQPGLHILAGPMGSGKTTTIYGVAQELAQQNKIVLTIEDPVEINNPNFIQLQVNNTADMTYTNLIKSGLRHRPDVFLIGEIRDTQTAQATVHAALSGHTVLTTIHALAASEVNIRLLEMGVKQAYLQASLRSITYQRLIPNTKNQLHALQTQLIGPKIWESSGDEWNEELAHALAVNKITAATYEKFKTLDPQRPSKFL